MFRHRMGIYNLYIYIYILNRNSDDRGYLGFTKRLNEMTSYNSRNYLQREQKTRKDQESFLANNARGGSHLTITCVKNQRLFYMCERERKGMTDELARPLLTEPRNFRGEKQKWRLGKIKHFECSVRKDKK